MGFIDWLQDLASINRVSYIEDSYGKESKAYTPVYSDIKCRLWKGTSRIVQSPEKEDKFIVTYKLYTLPENSEGKKWDEIIINWSKYIIFGWNPATWWSVNHYIYNIKSDE